MTKLNEAQKLLASIGAPFLEDTKQAHGGKLASWTKKGPGRYHLKLTKAELKARIKARMAQEQQEETA
jgi:hypothetical protein